MQNRLGKLKAVSPDSWLSVKESLNLDWNTDPVKCKQNRKLVRSSANGF